jgi:ribosomal protection tetracycline resistance protein
LSGTANVRDRVRFRGDQEGKITAISVFDRGKAVRQSSVSAGQIGKLWGLDEIKIGDAIGASPNRPDEHRFFAPPTLEAIVVPRSSADTGRLYKALTQLSEQDPLINVRRDNFHQETAISLYGEVQKEVIEATLANEFGIDVTFRETTTICVERLAGTGAAVEVVKQEENPFLATVGLRLEAGAPGDGVSFRLEVELGTLPLAFMKAIEGAARATLQRGLHGWQVIDCTVTVTHSGYISLSSTAGDFRNLTPLVLMAALQQAGTIVCEPVHRFQLDVPADTIGSILRILARLGATPGTPQIRETSCVLAGEIPAAQVHHLQQQLPEMTRGEGVLENAFDHYRPIRGTIPVRRRTGLNPLNREEYLLQLSRRF